VSVLVVPPFDEEPFPSLGGQVCDFIEERAVYGPGSLKGQPAKLNADQKLIIWRAYEVFPKGHPRAGRRRFDRVGYSVRKGSAKTEFMAWIAFAELHPDAPVRCAGFERDGSLLQGRPVRDPYIPLLANTQEQVAELAYGALMVICEEGADPELFDIGLDRIIRLGPGGEADGKAVPIAGAPNARDGARTTFQGFDETHRLHLPSHKAAVQTMNANLPKRPDEDPWTLSTTTAGEPGQDSVAEDEFFEAEAIARGETERPTLFFFHRQASDGYDLADFEQRVEAVREASGPDVAEWSDLDRIAGQWDRPKADKTYLERVWLNRWTAQESQAFNVQVWRDLDCGAGVRIPDRARVTIGFDGARMRDATALVVTDIKTGFQELKGLWERPLDAEDDWEVDEQDVTDTVDALFKRFRVQKMYCDPPHWNSTVGEWSVKYPDAVQEWWTNRRRPMVNAIQGFKDAMEAGKISHGGDPDLERHIAAAGKVQLNLTDDEGKRLWILGKLHPDRKFDACMAAILSWQARMDELGNVPKKRRRASIQRVR
jgi:phage terminase large subunit-like protein